jgi:hypothetical protein
MFRTAECHPERPYLAKGLCASCYVTARKKRQRPQMTEEQRNRERAYSRSYRKVWREEHREQSRAQSRKDQAKSYKQDPVKHRHAVAATRYGITVPEYQALIAQDFCDACGQPSAKTLEIDHCHDTGLIRGVLCHNCNSALGHAKDDIDRLTRLIAYISSHQSEQAA